MARCVSHPLADLRQGRVDREILLLTGLLLFQSDGSTRASPGQAWRINGMNAKLPVDTLFYDGQCPLCQKEMARLARSKDKKLTLVDIHALTDFDGLPSREALLRDLHLRRGGAFLIGIDANVAAWQHTRYGVFWRWLRWPGVRPFAEFGYRRWAAWRYRRLYGDDGTACAGAAATEACATHPRANPTHSTPARKGR